MRQLAVFGLLLMFCACNKPEPKTRKALFIIVDGIPADVIERVETPALDSIGKAGAYTRAYVGGEKDGYSQTPTISAVGYNSLLTGTWVNKHNVWDNDIKEPNYHYWNIFRFFKQQYPNGTTAVFSTWLDNRTKLVGSDAEAAGRLQPDYYFDGLEADTLNYPHDTLSNYIHGIDEVVTDTAAAAIRRLAPDLSWVYLQYTDDMGHIFGDSRNMDEAVTAMDRQVSRIWEAVRYREQHFNEEWQVWITTDHGRDQSGHHHGGQSERERTTWIFTNAGELNTRFLKQQPAVVDIMPSIASYLKITIPEDAKREIDGIPLTGRISATDLHAVVSGGQAELSWNVIDKEGKAKIWLATTNHFKYGRKDEYKMIKEVPVKDGKASIDIAAFPSDFYKIVIEMPFNSLNRWILKK